MPTRRVDLNDYSLDLRQAVDEAAAALRDAKLVCLPTETVYGIAAKPDVAGEAIARLRGDATGPLTPHLNDATQVEQFGVEPGEAGRKLLRKLWPGPVAMVFEVPADRREKAAKDLGVDASLLFAADGRVTLRCPDDPITLAAIEAAGQPCVLTRAGLPRGNQASVAPSVETLSELGVDLLLDGGPTRYARPSTVVRVHPGGSGFDVAREGIYDKRIIERLLRTTVLFVCSGNTCRSPMAMAIGRKKLADKLGTTPDKLGDKGFEVVSAGTGAMPGMRATPAAVDAVTSFGGDLTSHRSTPLDVALIHRADLIVAMTDGHRQGVLGLVPSAANKVVMLDPEGDIDDPIGADAGHYAELAGRIAELVEARLDESSLV